MFDINPGDLVFMLSHKADGKHLSSFSGHLALVLSIDPPITDYAWLHVQCGPDMLNSDYFIRTDQVRQATSEEAEAWSLLPLS